MTTRNRLAPLDPRCAPMFVSSDPDDPFSGVPPTVKKKPGIYIEGDDWEEMRQDVKTTREELQRLTELVSRLLDEKGLANGEARR